MYVCMYLGLAVVVSASGHSEDEVKRLRAHGGAHVQKHSQLCSQPNLQQQQAAAAQLTDARH